MLHKAGLNSAIYLVATALVAVLLGACGAPQMPRPPEHYGEFEPSPAVETSTPGHRASVASIRQRRLWVNETGKPLSSLTVTVELSAQESGGPWRLAASDFQMVADVPEHGRLLARDDRRTRPPNAMEIRRDGKWRDADSVVVESGTTRTVRLDFDDVTPYAVVGEKWGPGAHMGGWNAYYRPVGLRLTYPSPTGSTEELAVADPDTASPTWERDHVDTRLHMLIAPSILSQREGGTGFLFGADFGAMHDFQAPVYVRWAAEWQLGHVPDANGVVAGADADPSRATYLRLAAPLTAGGVLKSTNYDMRLGAGWSAGIVKREGIDPVAVPHYLVGEYEMVVRPNQQYPFRTHDFAGNVGFYTRMSYQLGNLAEREEPPGFLFTFGIALHPGG
ncbi:MAG: hypothetical protein ACQEVA_10135 [Myxococcota bacterium]